MIRRIWSLPLGAHVLALFVVVTVGIALTGPGVAFFSDEGAVAVQARLLVDDHTWLYAPPTAEIDPEGAARPFQNGDFGTEGLAPYAKHPLYPITVATVARGWSLGAVGLSIAGLVAAAALAAALARRVAPAAEGLDRASLWLVGVASPLWFAGGLIVAHTLAAAATAVAVWVAIALVAPRRDLGRAATVALLATLGGACLIAGALRTEAVFLGPALAVALVVFGSGRRVAAVVTAVVAFVASLAARLLDRAWSTSIVGESIPAPTDNAVPSTGSWTLDRLHGLYTTVVQAGYSLTRGQEVMLWLAVLLLVGAAAAWRARWVTARVALALGSAGTALYVLRALIGPDGAIPGLFVAFPLLAVMLVLVDRRVVESRPARIMLLTAALCIGAVILTQYPIGGGLEWGWRYAGFVLPLVVPPVAWGAWLLVRDRADARAAVVPGLALLVVIALVPSLAGLRAQAVSHDADRRVAASMAVVADEATVDGARPVVLSWNRFLPQILSQVFEDYDWVVPARDEVVTYADRLADDGVQRVILVGPASQDVVAELGEQGWRPVVAGPDAPYDVVVLEHA